MIVTCYDSRSAINGAVCVLPQPAFFYPAWFSSVLVIEYPLPPCSIREETMTNIFVGNLSYQTTAEELEVAFAAFGTVERVSLVRDRDTGKSRGFAFVEMPNSDEAVKAISALNGREINGRALNVNEARPRQDRPTGNRSGGGSGNRGGFGRSRREPRW